MANFNNRQDFNTVHSNTLSNTKILFIHSKCVLLLWEKDEGGEKIIVSSLQGERLWFFTGAEVLIADTALIRQCVLP